VAGGLKVRESVAVAATAVVALAAAADVAAGEAEPQSAILVAFEAFRGGDLTGEGFGDFKLPARESIGRRRGWNALEAIEDGKLVGIVDDLVWKRLEGLGVKEAQAVFEGMGHIAETAGNADGKLRWIGVGVGNGGDSFAREEGRMGALGEMGATVGGAALKIDVDAIFTVEVVEAVDALLVLDASVGGEGAELDHDK
jgi:hypothetical protein